MTLGEKLSLMRKNSSFTQEEIANHLGVSPQAVSKWENDLSCPDIMLLPKIAELYGKTIDELLDEEETARMPAADNAQKKNKWNLFKHSDTMSKKNSTGRFLKVNVLSRQGDNINAKLPVALVKSLKSILKGIKVNGDIGVDLNGIDFDMVFELVDSGIMGEIVNVDTSNGDKIRVYVEA